MEKLSGSASASDSFTSARDLDSMLRRWSGDRDVVAAREAALEFTAVELAQRIAKLKTR